jgi:predicted nucleic acid-binding protein
MIILDTDVLIEIFDKGSTKGDDAIAKIEEIGEDIAITSINLHEIQYGIHKFGKKKIKELDLLATFEFNGTDAKLSAKLELECERKGTLVSRIDSMIAAIAINRKARIFTFNKKHFQSFSKLKLI